MSGRHQPSNGADAAPYVTRPYLVLMVSDDGDRKQVRVPAALGKQDARNQARLDWPDYSPLSVEEAALDFEEAEELRGRVLA